MIDLKYHIASIVAVFLALGLGVLIGSTIVGSDVIVNQQKKMIDSLEAQFSTLREQENQLESENDYRTKIIGNYENYSQILLPPMVKGRLAGRNMAIVVCGDTEIPAGMLNTLTLAQANVVSKTVILSNGSLNNVAVRKRVAQYYNVDADTASDILRHYIGLSVAAYITNGNDTQLINFLQDNNLIKFSGFSSDYLSGVILVGGVENLGNNFSASFDQGIIEYLLEQNIRVFGVESSQTNYSYMGNYQKNNISTIDNIDLSPGQISLVFAIEGEAGDYGVKTTAKKFMPSLPVDVLKGS